MKRKRIRKAISLIAAFVLAAAAALPVFALEQTPDFIYYDAHDMEKLTAFWHQEAYGGLTNGEAAYDFDWPEPSDTFGYCFGCPIGLSYDGGYYTKLLDLPSDYYDYGTGFSFGFVWSEDVWSTEYVDGQEYACHGWIEYCPDLYGELDLEDTNVYEVREPRTGQTHITSLNLNDCDDLMFVQFSRQDHCTSIEALSCPQLKKLEAEHCPCEHIAFSPAAFEEPVTVNALGPGTVGVNYNQNMLPNRVKLYAYNSTNKFVGWYSNGELVSAERYFTIAQGGDITAYFGGDADGDQSITTVDALMVLRMALGITSLPESFSDLDMNNSGILETSDALTILRCALGTN